MEHIIDRDYEYVMSMDEDGWLVGGGYKTFDYSLDSVWMRDYGPVGLLESDDKVGSLDTIYRHYQYRLKDDKLPTILSNFNRMPVYDTPIILGTQI